MSFHRGCRGLVNRVESVRASDRAPMSCELRQNGAYWECNSSSAAELLYSRGAFVMRGRGPRGEEYFERLRFCLLDRARRRCLWPGEERAAAVALKPVAGITRLHAL